MFTDLNELLKNDKLANEYWQGLPDYVREQISTRGHNVNSIASLQDYAENLLRGDG